MKVKILASVSTAIALAMISGSGAVFAQAANPSAQPAEIELSPAGRRILCERYPLNSRCQGGSAGAPSPSSSPSPDSAAPSTSPTPSVVPPESPAPSGLSEPGTSPAPSTAPPSGGAPGGTLTPGL